jgi:hypothetical protein
VKALTVGDGADITAAEMKVEQLLSLAGSAKLAAAAGTTIEIGPKVRIEMRAVGGKVPFLNLSVLGDDYDGVPAVIVVDMTDAGLTKTIGFEHLLIAGTTFGNCPDWRRRAAFHQMDDGLALTCKNTKGSAPRAKHGEEIGLYVRGKRGSSFAGWLVLIGVAVALLTAVASAFTIRGAYKIMFLDGKNNRIEAVDRQYDLSDG